MKKIFISLCVVIVIFVIAVMARKQFLAHISANQTEGHATTTGATTSAMASSTVAIPSISQIEPVKVIAEGLEIPWDIAFLPSGDFLVSERPGRLVRISVDGTRTQIPLTGVKHTSEGGLLGIKLHPNFAANKFIYLYMSSPGQNSLTQNRVVRYTLEGDVLANEKTIIDQIPGAIYHDGGRMEFGPDRLLYVTTGDATKSAIAQDLKSLGGKILRLNDDGTIPSDNPFGTAVYSYGHRNPQGLAWDDQGRLWETEHGRSGVTTGYDEINLIEKGKNYGWPTIEGPAKKEGMVSPILQSGASDTWAPASLAFLDGSLYFGGLFGETLYEAVIGIGSSTEAIGSAVTVTELKRNFFKEYGRIRTVRVGPDGMIYMMTSNRDGRGKPKTGDDKIIRVNPAALR